MPRLAAPYTKNQYNKVKMGLDVLPKILRDRGLTSVLLTSPTLEPVSQGQNKPWHLLVKYATQETAVLTP